MIRQDYILRIIEQFAQALARIKHLKQNREFPEAVKALEDASQTFFGLDAASVSALSEGQLMARLISGESTHLIREKALMLVTLLNEAAELHIGQNQIEQGRACHLKALNLLLEVMLRYPETELPDFVPSIQGLANQLEGCALPVRTNAALMQHFEQIGSFAKAEDQLFEIIGSEPNNPAVLDLGIGFYQRLLQESDPVLQGGDLPRTEVEAGLAELHERRKIAKES